MSQDVINDGKKKLLLAVSGGIAAYKTPDLVRRLKERGFDVRVVVTKAATEFVTPMSLQAVSGYPVHHDLFDPAAEAAMGHIELARWADVILVAPATANTLAKICQGEAGNLLLTVLLASDAPLVVAPAMNRKMWQAPSTQHNVEYLRKHGVDIIGPESGEQACGDIGAGRMSEPDDIASQLFARFIEPKNMVGKTIMITAGPTVEAIDPVRFISNHSSGKMGYALALAAKNNGAKVLLVSGPVSIASPAGVELLNVTSAAQMQEAVADSIDDVDVFIGCAAVADYTPVKVATQKIKKNDEHITLELQRNPDILAWVAAQEKRPYVVGFAAESEKLEAHALSKLKRKNLDLICANDISCSGVGFNSCDNQLLLLTKDGSKIELKQDSKVNLANRIISEISQRIEYC